MAEPVLSVSVIDRGLILLILAEAATFCLFWFDKHQSREHGWRVGESTLLLASVFGGLGGWTGQHLLRHKTRKEPFRTRLGVMILTHLIGVASLFWLLLSQMPDT
ncbi:uncharacterized membrane protein YsdA (DUF1294 family) [Brevundimonas alba]|uniref:Uncharacterized membrane protein YsdA (DUF1294 family) n=1 Tax=Brevundimonas alba TaxID=74314 RepID=A0A7X5YKI0_9CAUL|nr:DUF1294 domain-containing protein [Brevundimonas alba]NJC41443.1 uncharacterized membrane protein YsdA (DUF1294 family) [Brevundimonas alba]